MERSNLFRGKRTDTGEWVYGWYCRYPFGRWPLKDAIIPSDDAEDGHFAFVEIDPDTLGEYTGLPDKNGIKIFEGDIVKKKDYNGIREMKVIFSKGEFCCWYDGAYKFYSLNDSRIEVVGNIYESVESLVKE